MDESLNDALVLINDLADELAEIHQGDCPLDPNDPTKLDPECPVCRLIDRAVTFAQQFPVPKRGGR